MPATQAVYTLSNYDSALQQINYDLDKIFLCFNDLDIYHRWLARLNNMINNVNCKFYGICFLNEYLTHYEQFITLINDDNFGWVINFTVDASYNCYLLASGLGKVKIHKIVLWGKETILNHSDWNTKWKYVLSEMSNINLICITGYSYQSMYIASRQLLEQIKHYKDLNIHKNKVFIAYKGLKHYHYVNFVDITQQLKILNHILLKDCLDDINLIQQYDINLISL